MDVKVKKFYKDSKIPVRSTKSSAGLDIFCYIKEGFKYIKKGEISLINTGIGIQLESGYACFVHARSGMSSKHGICLINGVGVIDADYTGEIKIPLINLGEKDYKLEHNQKIAQLVIQKIESTNFIEVTNFKETERGENGFGSTGLF